MEVRKTRLEELDAVMEVYAYARKFMAEHDNPNQWKNNKPSREQIEKDILGGKHHVCVENDQIAAVFYFAHETDPTYVKIYDGAWLNDGQYMTVHRVAVDSTLRRKGIASFLLAAAVEEAKELGLGSLRLDTHMENKVMQATLLRNGLTNCGTIILGRANVSDPTGLPEGPVTPDMVPAKFLRWAYEKLI